GPSARLARDVITHVEVVEYEELGMEAVWMIDVVDFPAFIVVDDKGNDFFEQVGRPGDIANIKRKSPGAGRPVGRSPASRLRSAWGSLRSRTALPRSALRYGFASPTA